MHLRPLQDWAVIRKSEPEGRTAGGIIIPEVAKEKPLQGVVVAIGPGKFKIEKGKEKEKKKKFIPTVLKPGQHVMYQKYAEREIELGGKTVTLVREEDILGILEESSLVKKKTHEIEAKKEQPVALRAEAKVPSVTPPPPVGKKAFPAKTKPAAEKPAEKKAPKKPASKKEKPSAIKAAAKKPSAKKAAAPASKKTAKKAPAAKKSAAQKPAVKKLTAKQSATRKPAKKQPAKAKGKKK